MANTRKIEPSLEILSVEIDIGCGKLNCKEKVEVIGVMSKGKFAKTEFDGACPLHEDTFYSLLKAKKVSKFISDYRIVPKQATCESCQEKPTALFILKSPMGTTEHQVCSGHAQLMHENIARTLREDAKAGNSVSFKLPLGTPKTDEDEFSGGR